MTATERLASIAILVGALAVLAIRYAEPILDGDLFWHLKYAEQMLAHGTLVTDHTLYSWTPTSNDTIYCAWLAELVLYGLYQIGDLPILFALRYLCVATVGAMMLAHAHARGLLGHPMNWAIVLVALLTAMAGTLIKPELFSLVAFSLVVFAYLRAREADRAGTGIGWFVAVPLVVLVWVNAHGGFILAAPFFAATFAGEVLTRLLAPARALSPRGLRALLAAWVASAIALLATPYGWRYPAQLIADYALRPAARPDEIWNAAYQSVFGRLGGGELRDYGLLLASTVLGLAIANRRRLVQVDWGLLLAALCYLPLFVLYARATFYPAIVFAFLALDLLRPITSESRLAWRLLGTAAACMLALMVGTRALYAARFTPLSGAWIGFGISHVNPVAETEFLAASRLGPRLYNTFDSGGYLLWRLDPVYKVMADPRSFPYLSWFRDHYAFAEGKSFDDFLARYPADTAIIDLARFGTWRNFLQSRDWRVVYYGPTAAIFVHRTVPDDRLAAGVAPTRFADLRNAQTALDVFNFAVVIEDYKTAWPALRQLETTLRHQVDRGRLARALALREGHARLRGGNFDLALPLFEQASTRPIQGWREAVVLRLLRERAASQPADAARLEAALRELALPADDRSGQ